MNRALYLAGYCGDYCGKCPNFDSKCPGCSIAFHPDCQFIQCCESKGIGHCGLCDEFPCRRLQNFKPDDRADMPPDYHIESLRLRAEIGTEEWLEIQREKWKH